VIEELRAGGSIEEQTRRLREEMVGVTAHGCVMFRRDAYEQAGGYRWQFYYAQDSDLWLRLGEVGSVGGVGECLYELRESTGSISSRHRLVQREFCRLARECYLARRSGRSEQPFLEVAGLLRDRSRCRCSSDGPRALTGATTLRIMAARLASRGDSRAAVRYLRQAIGTAPWDPRCWRDLFRLVARRPTRH
jgi:hypothetical protein